MLARAAVGRLAWFAGAVALATAAFATDGTATATPAQDAPPRPERSFAAARARAAAEQKPLLLVVLDDREPACERMTERVYVDAAVVAQLRKFVLLVANPGSHAVEPIDRDGETVQGCMKYEGLVCSDHQAIEKELRPQLLTTEAGVIVPQHLVFRADGTLAVKRPYAMKSEGFLEFLAACLPSAAGGTSSGPVQRSATVEAQARALLEARDPDAREAAARTLASDASPEREQAFLEVLGRLRRSEERGSVVRALGYPEHHPWAPTIALLLDEKERHLRQCAIVTLEEMAADAVIDDLLAAWEREKEPALRQDLLRALGPCGGGNAQARAIVIGELAATKEATRIAAALSLGALLADDAEVPSALEARWKKEKSAKVRVALLWGMGASQDRAQEPLLDRLLAKEKEDDLLKLSVVVRERLHGKAVGAAPKALGKAGGKEVRRILGPLFVDDPVERNALRDADRKFSGKQ